MEIQLDTRSIMNTTDHSYFGGRGPHITHIPLESISKLAPFSALIISIIFVIYFVIRLYILEGYLLRRVYGDIYTRMDETTRRGFVNHHIAGATKLTILVVAAYPFIDVAFGNSTLHSSFAGSKIVTQGDILVVAAQALIAMYVFELFYRPKISPVSAGHHIGTIMIGQSAIAISLNLVREKDATIEFILCTVWGAFDIVSEFLPHVSIILYRVYPTSHRFLRNIFCMSCITTLTGTVAETILTMYLFGSLWDRWTIAFKVATPMLHVLFASCQMWGSWNFYKMYQKQKRTIEMKESGLNDVELAPQKDELKASEPLKIYHATERTSAEVLIRIPEQSHRPAQ
ncbi:Uncharacterized protein BP5553_04531 [Venustampulla echinocandica]|uniref:TLC domain-containing protein n=1 Tax=Venustampulla echinocandica TaxID=2656787 RepID=A0A370TNK2_9HELO|nr:Uncharacterized protein BP5553_04531 [Venustampulla echinocandica]RDL37098.1 Uncharacterized protein BP5553_04531 [Venustampulla echinocandica]